MNVPSSLIQCVCDYKTLETRTTEKGIRFMVTAP
jgi:hypothetical protein